jgi:hypothetical protein
MSGRRTDGGFVTIGGLGSKIHYPYLERVVEFQSTGKRRVFYQGKPVNLRGENEIRSEQRNAISIKEILV